MDLNVDRAREAINKHMTINLDLHHNDLGEHDITDWIVGELVYSMTVDEEYLHGSFDEVMGYMDSSLPEYAQFYKEITAVFAELFNAEVVAEISESMKPASIR